MIVGLIGPCLRPLAGILENADGRDFCIVVAVAVDRFRQRRLHPAFAWGAPLFIVSMHLANIGERTEAWTRIAIRLVS